MPGSIYIFSAGVWRLRDEIAAMTGLVPRRAWLAAPNSGAIAGWGHKATADRARALARRAGLPYIAFEDGFLRSLKPGPGQRPAAMIMDRSGIYYDARAPSDLETLLQSASFTADECQAASELIVEIAGRRLSKYNHGADLLPSHSLDASRPLVLLIDQTRDDESVAGGLANAATFERMAEAAIAENPGAQIALKLHPETISGAKQGYLQAIAGRHAMTLLSDHITPWALIGRHPRVYTVSSQFGFEALLGGCRVTCFGVPFYAGWGLSDDRLRAPRRTGKRSIAELAAAVYLRYCHYFDIWRRTPIDAMTAVDQLDFQRRHYLGNDRPVICYRIAPWKRRAAAAMLDGPHGAALFTRNLATAGTAARKRGAVIAAWGVTATRLRVRQTFADTSILTIEDGFIRSAGLGAAFTAPLSLVFDKTGIYYDSTRPSDIELLLANRVVTADERARGALLRTRIVSAGVTKYNLGGDAAPVDLPADKPIILVPGQVADDAAVLAAGEFREHPAPNVNAVLLNAVRRRNPDAYVIFKPHPDVEKLGRRGALSPEQENRDADRVVRNTSLETLLQVASRVETCSSLSGFEALLRNVPVTVHGMPF